MKPHDQFAKNYLEQLLSPLGIVEISKEVSDETRPRLQGAKLTAWECAREGIPVTVITDSMAAHCMQQKLQKRLKTEGG